MSCPEVMYQAYYPYLYQRASSGAGVPRPTFPSPFTHQYERVSFIYLFIINFFSDTKRLRTVMTFHHHHYYCTFEVGGRRGKGEWEMGRGGRGRGFDKLICRI